MGDEPWNQLRNVFLTALERPSDERREYLEAECGDDTALRELVRAMLEAHDQGSTLPSTIAPADRELEMWGATLPSGARVCGYEVVRRIAAGSMGTVYEAHQTAPERAVALKMMHPWLVCPSSLERFRLETQILARLQHPGIARVYDAGIHRADESSAPSVPYYVMELVDGLSLSAHVAARCLDRRARLRLFVTICDAVQHAHQHGVLHRDLKPSNILIDPEGQPKLIDFGVARVLEQEAAGTELRTQVGQVLGTFAYMSPEQAAGDAEAVDMRADVYALGVILFELVTDSLPHDLAGRTVAEALRTVQEDEPAALGRVDRRLRGDLEIVAAKALAKDRERRYSSVAELGADVRRYLAELPIAARPTGLCYRICKFTRRNRLASFALAACAAAVVVGVAASLTFGVEAIRQREKADVAAAEAAQVSSFLGEVFLVGASRAQLSPSELLEIILKHLDESGDALHPTAEARLRELAGDAYGSRNQHGKAAAQFERAWVIRRELCEEDDPLALQAAEDLSVAYHRAGRVADARRQLRGLLETRRRTLGPDHLAGASRNGRLALLVAALLPDEPEVAWLQGRRRSEAELVERPRDPAARFDGPVVFDDGFDGETLDPRWSPWIENAAGWDHEFADSRLTVCAIEPLAYVSENGHPVSSAGLTLRLGYLSDFSVSLEFTWDSSSPEYGPECRAMQSLWLILGGASGGPIACCAYEDAWFGSLGQRRAKCSGAESNTGNDTLPAAGHASVRIDRVRGSLTVFWNGDEFLVATSTDPLAELQIQMCFDPRQINGLRSHFGTLTLEHARVAGISVGS